VDKKLNPLPVQYLELSENPAWHDLHHHAEEKIEEMKEKFFSPDFSEPTEQYRLRAAYYKELLEILDLRIRNSVQKGKSKPKSRRPVTRKTGSLIIRSN
jgi:hypothetical protein